MSLPAFISATIVCITHAVIAYYTDLDYASLVAASALYVAFSKKD